MRVVWALAALLGFALAARAQAEVSDAGSVAARWQRAQRCAGAHAARERGTCEARCEAERRTTSERPPVKSVKKLKNSGATCRCKCTAAALGQLEQACGELGLVSGLAELGPGARACVAPGLSPEAACVLRCDDVLTTCVDGCDHGIALVSEPTAASCISGCYAFQTSCLGLCADKAQRPASLTNSKSR